MVRDFGALRRAAARTSGAGVGGDRPGAPTEPGAAASRPPLRAIQPSASGAPRWSVPTPTKSLGVRTGRVPTPRKLGPKLVGRSGLTTTAGASSTSTEELLYKVRDAISFWEENHNNVQNVLSKYGSHAHAKVGDYFDENFVKSSEDVLKLQLELDIFKMILLEEKTAHVEVERKMTDLDDELKALRFVREDLESDLVKSIKESAELKKSKDQTLEILQKKDMEISRLNSELDILRKQEYSANEDPKMQTLKFYDATKSPFSTKLKRMQASVEKSHNLHTSYQQDQESHSSVEQEKDEIRRQVEVETAEVIISLQQQLDARKKNELLTKENLEKLQLENNQLSGRLVEMMKENERLSMENAELKSQLKQNGRTSCILEELAHESKITGKLEEDMIKLGSLQNESSNLLDEKQCCEAQVHIFKVKLGVAQALIAESESIATRAQQLVEKKKAYAEKKDKEVKLLERSIEDLEITVCELENKVKIVMEEAKHERMQREELELKLWNIRQQKLVVPSFGNASSSLGEEMVNLDPIRHSQDINDEPLDAQELAETEPEEPKQPDVEMEEAYSSDEDYRPEISDFEQTSPNEHMERYNVSEQSELHGVVGVDSDQSQSESMLEEQLPPPFVEALVEVVEENELPPLALVRFNDPVDYMRAPSDELKRLRSRNHYEGQRTATDRRFWSIEQQDLYTSIYSRAGLANMKWIDWEYIDSIEQFAGVRKRCAHLGLEYIMSYCCHWDNELIRQFYSTVHISADKTSMTWMTDGRKITTNKRAWEERFNIPTGFFTEIHSQLFLNDDTKRILYTSTEYTLGHISGLSSLASIATKILKTTIYPRFGNTTHSWNVLYHIVEQHPFDIISLIFSEIDLLVSVHSRTKDRLLYASYIMGMIVRAFDYKGSRDSRHHSYKPRPDKSKLSKKSHHLVGAPAKAALHEPTFQPEVATAGCEAYFESAGHQSHVEAAQGRAVLVQPITHTDFFQVVENGIKPIRDTLASMESGIGIVEGASVPAKHISSSSSTQIPAASSCLEASVCATTSPAPPQAARTSLPSCEQPSIVYTDNPGGSAQPVVHVRPSPFSGFH